MSKKLITACLGVLALAAFALPTTASASPVITHPTGTVLNPATGSCTNVSGTICITGTNVGNINFYNGSNVALLDCSKAVLTGYLRKNKENHIEGDIHTVTGTGTGGQDPEESKNMPECTGTNGLPNTTVTSNGTDPVGTKIDEEDVTNGTPYCVTATSGAEDKFTLRGGTCSEVARAIAFVIKPTGLAACTYSRAAGSPIMGTYTTHATGDAILTVTPSLATGFAKTAGGILCPAEGRLGMSITLETDTTASNDPLYIS